MKLENMEKTLKLTEDETIIILMKHLINDGWIIDSYCLGQTRGCDIIASKNETKIFIEVKGARASDKSPTKKRAYFDSGQIKDHFGKAIVKILNDKFLSPKSKFAIAHPDDSEIKKSIAHLIPFLKLMEIKHYWVSPDGSIVEE